MKEFAPAPKHLPVTVSVYFPSKDIRFNSILLNPTDTVKHLREMLAEKVRVLFGRLHLLTARSSSRWATPCSGGRQTRSSL
jgi:hypothetical protein